VSITLTLGAENVIPGCQDVHPFRFCDGTIAVKGAWTSDGGGTWGPTPIGGRVDPGPGCASGEQVATYTDGNGGIIALQATMTGEMSPYALPYRMSTNDWGAVSSLSGACTAPDAKPFTGDAGDTSPAYIEHHGVQFTDTGELIATFFGNNVGDTRLYDGYPAVYGAIKSRSIVMYSPPPYGSTWGNAKTIGYDKMLVRGTQPDAQGWDLAEAPTLDQEGMNEAGMCREGPPNRHYLVAVRSGSRKSVATAPVPHTPIYLIRSPNGYDWDLPRATAPVGSQNSGIIRSASTRLAVLGNGVVCMTFCEPYGYVAFSEDGGRSGWGTVLKLTNSGNDLDLVQIGWNTVLLVYYSTTAGDFVARQIVVDVDGQQNNAYIQTIATPWGVKSGRSALLQWFSIRATNLKLNGGPYTNLSVNPNSYKTTGMLSATTEFTLSGTSTVDSSPVSTPLEVRVS